MQKKYVATLAGTLFVLNAAVILMYWWLGSRGLLFPSTPGSIAIAFGRLTGLFAQYLLLVQLVLVGRIRAFERSFGFMGMNWLHRKVGKWLLVFILLHPILITYGYSRQHELGLVAQFLMFISLWEHVILAVLGLSLFVIAATVSYSWIRDHLKYETWYSVHLLMYVAIGLVFWHQTETADVSGGSAFTYWYVLNFSVFGLLLIYRFLRPLYLFHRHSFFVSHIVQETPDVVSIYIGGRQLDRFEYEAGQYANVHFLHAGFWFSHPFSFSTAPDGKTIRFSIKQLGDFTKKLPALPIGTKVILDGPYGVFTARHAVKEKIALIAGGIGITPLRGLLEQWAKEGRDAILLYANKDPKAIALQAELESIVAASPRTKLTHVISTMPPDNEKNPGYEYGFVDEARFKRLVPDFMERDMYICGPPPMMDAFRKMLKTNGAPRAQVHFEKFS
jgi:predicted ferric reductase